MALSPVFRKILKKTLLPILGPILASIIGLILRNRTVAIFPYLENKGLHITPVLYYSPIPDTRALSKELWHRKSELIGININAEQQLRFLAEVFPFFKTEYDFPEVETEIPHEYHYNNGLFECIDAEVLHCMIRHYQPKKIIEIGSGYSTYISARACLLNKEKNNNATELYAIEPKPRDTLRKGFPGLCALIPKPVEQIELDFFTQLMENDILFIDSSHVIRIGNDVEYEYLEILPRLKKGVIVQIHDICLPAQYPEKWIMNNCLFWTEQYLVQAFLCFNDAFEVLWSSSYMHFSHPNELKTCFPKWGNSFALISEDNKRLVPSYDNKNVLPTSLWIRKRS